MWMVDGWFVGSLELEACVSSKKWGSFSTSSIIKFSETLRDFRRL